MRYCVEGRVREGQCGSVVVVKGARGDDGEVVREIESGGNKGEGDDNEKDRV